MSIENQCLTFDRLHDNACVNTDLFRQVASSPSPARDEETRMIRPGQVAARICALSFTLLIAMLLPVTTLQAQTATGEVNGSVVDSQGSTVPNATVTLINQATGIETTRTTNSSGG